MQQQLKRHLLAGVTQTRNLQCQQGIERVFSPFSRYTKWERERELAGQRERWILLENKTDAHRPVWQSNMLQQMFDVIQERRIVSKKRYGWRSRHRRKWGWVSYSPADAWGLASVAHCIAVWDWDRALDEIRLTFVAFLANLRKSGCR